MSTTPQHMKTAYCMPNCIGCREVREARVKNLGLGGPAGGYNPHVHVYNEEHVEALLAAREREAAERGAREERERVEHQVAYETKRELVCSCGTLIRERLHYSLATDFGRHIRAARTVGVEPE